jgi:RNA polymerase sigma factor (sigma-70 family)
MTINSQEPDSTEAELELCETIMRVIPGAVRALVWRILGPSDESTIDDVLSEVAVRAFKGGFRGVSKQTTFLLGICKNICKEERRRRERFGTTGGDYQGVDEADPMQGLLTDELRRSVRDCLEATPSPYKEALLLYYYEDKPSCRKVATAMAASISQVKIWLYRGRLKIQECLASKGGYADLLDEI